MAFQISATTQGASRYYTHVYSCDWLNYLRKSGTEQFSTEEIRAVTVRLAFPGDTRPRIICHDHMKIQSMATMVVDRSLGMKHSRIGCPCPASLAGGAKTASHDSADQIRLPSSGLHGDPARILPLRDPYVARLPVHILKSVQKLARPLPPSSDSFLSKAFAAMYSSLQNCRLACLAELVSELLALCKGCVHSKSLYERARRWPRRFWRLTRPAFASGFWILSSLLVVERRAGPCPILNRSLTNLTMSNRGPG